MSSINHCTSITFQEWQYRIPKPSSNIQYCSSPNYIYLQGWRKDFIFSTVEIFSHSSEHWVLSFKVVSGIQVRIMKVTFKEEKKYMLYRILMFPVIGKKMSVACGCDTVCKSEAGDSYCRLCNYIESFLKYNKLQLSADLQLLTSLFPDSLLHTL